MLLSSAMFFQMAQAGEPGTHDGQGNTYFNPPSALANVYDMSCPFGKHLNADDVLTAITDGKAVTLKGHSDIGMIDMGFDPNIWVTFKTYIDPDTNGWVIQQTGAAMYAVRYLVFDRLSQYINET